MDALITPTETACRPFNPSQPLFDPAEEMWGTKRSGQAPASSARATEERPVADAALDSAVAVLRRTPGSAYAIAHSATELLRYLGLERAAIYFVDTQRGLLSGTFGTDRHGQMTDERHVAYGVGTFETLAFQNALSGVARWLMVPSAPQIEHGAQGPIAFGRGWVAMTPIWGPRGPMGIIYNDAAITGSVPSALLQQRVARFAQHIAAALAALEDVKAQPSRQGVPASQFAPVAAVPTPAPQPAARPEASQQSHAAVRLVMEALRQEPKLTGGTLSERVGLSDGHLARLFKAEAGISMVEYRNRLRLDRFFAAVDSCGSNLLEASQKAGFGSYAQFHRVFRRVVGMAPRDYLAQLKMTSAAAV